MYESEISFELFSVIHYVPGSPHFPQRMPGLESCTMPYVFFDYSHPHSSDGEQQPSYPAEPATTYDSGVMYS